ncbi:MULTISPECIES: acyl carrier protein [Streptomyces]|uniref:Acyl carrier protein n=1 Tax=Streptomyces morookaense TaxID=1970 RepID=A0A7Y7B1J0_STRMO|nr:MULTISPECIES: acyl carrier protein [Streptomyces]MCC2278697.1 acyl carrier protein [Streptomyces sp. ET3-23]NVK77284.1 acyl carrier protein [Streptomyces morookaense]GHF18058.1 coronafacic acid synthetase [Streptomyces morookaense]
MTIADIIKDILVTKLYVESSPDEIALDDHFHRDLGVDSLGFVELRYQVEEKFGISVSDDDFNPENFMSIGTLVAYIEKAQTAAVPAVK